MVDVPLMHALLKAVPRLAYAITVHKAQGSEYPAVVIPVTTQHYPMLQRNLLYTGVTQAEAGRPGGAAQGRRDRGQGTARAQAMVEAAGVARGEPRGGRGDRRNFAIIRGGSGGRQRSTLAMIPLVSGATARTQGVGQPCVSRVGMPRCSSQLSGG